MNQEIPIETGWIIQRIEDGRYFYRVPIKRRGQRHQFLHIEEFRQYPTMFKSYNYARHAIRRYVSRSFGISQRELPLKHRRNFELHLTKEEQQEYLDKYRFVKCRLEIGVPYR